MRETMYAVVTEEDEGEHKWCRGVYKNYNEAVGCLQKEVWKIQKDFEESGDCFYASRLKKEYDGCFGEGLVVKCRKADSDFESTVKFFILKTDNPFDNDYADSEGV